jgi:hypothetical protein
MPDIQEIFDRIREKKGEKKKINESFRDALAGSKPYQDVIEEVKRLKEKKKSMENEIKREFEKDLEKLDEIKIDIQTDNILLSDLALNALVKGETVEIKDEYDTKYEPVFNVKFRKLG